MAIKINILFKMNYLSHILFGITKNTIYSMELCGVY